MAAAVGPELPNPNETSLTRFLHRPVDNQKASKYYGRIGIAPFCSWQPLPTGRLIEAEDMILLPGGLSATTVGELIEAVNGLAESTGNDAFAPQQEIEATTKTGAILELDAETAAMKARLDAISNIASPALKYELLRNA